MFLSFMQIELIRPSGDNSSIDYHSSIEEMIHFSQVCGRVCYSEKDVDELEKEPLNEALIDRLKQSGHHSVFEHCFLTFNMGGIPKALAMVLNNEQVYTTSEKSARYTQMKEIIPEQKEKYDKWSGILAPEIDKVYPQIDDAKKRTDNIRKLCQENARYMTSVFTPTKIVHTVNLRQINFLIDEFDKFVKQYKEGDDLFKKRLADSMEEFLAQEDVAKLKVEGLENKTDRHLSLLRDRPVATYFGDVYSTRYKLSFAGLAQAHRHRTIKYHVSAGTELGAPLGFFVPAIFFQKSDLRKEWLNDLKEIAKDDFPQAQFVLVNEGSTLENFRSKCILRLCGHAQYEIMTNTRVTARRYAYRKPEVKEWIKPKCAQGIRCSSPCAWGPDIALERIV